MVKRPNALIIGAGKAGSTSLHRYLDAHPAIYGSETKEVMYFTRHYGKGPDWYITHFPEQDGVEIYFESTPQYSFCDEFPAVAQRVHDLNPEMKLIYIIRHPIERIISHFNHWHRTQSDEYADLEDVLATPEKRSIFVNRTRYFHQIQAYQALFPDRQIHVVFLEDIQSDFTRTLDGVFDFLGVDQAADSIESTVHNKGATRKEGSRFGDQLSEESREALCSELSEDVQKLLAYCGKPADFWGPAFQ